MPDEPSHCITYFDNGQINWSTGKIIAKGNASPEDNKEDSHGMVPGAARADASRKIIEILKKIKIYNQLAVGEYASKNDVIMAGIEKTAWDADIKKQYYSSALAVEIIIEASIFGGFLQLVLPEEIRQIEKINPDLPANTVNQVEQNLYTGLVIDARQLSFEPVLYPVIISEKANEIYSSVFISREYAVQNGVCQYLCHMDQALKSKRIGNNPLIFKGLRKEGESNSTIVISLADAQILEKQTERHTFLKECRVIIVVDQ
ncbi:MAG: hypothetical protein GY729_01345 [Desulfobacteraceae bacterium]|nr:hypothetical protein [Desulfobacteraceae bacterium]